MLVWSYTYVCVNYSGLTRLQGVLRETNQSTLEAVTAFVKECTVEITPSRIPSALIITGANMASQSLLFQQLSDSLQTRAEAKVVSMRSGDASNLKAALRKIILDVVANSSDSGGEQDLSLDNDVCARVRNPTLFRHADLLRTGETVPELRS